MKRTVAILLAALAVVAFLWASASAGDYIEDLTVRDLHGVRIPKPWRDGFYTGMFLSLVTSKTLDCQAVTANTLVNGIDAALEAKEITRDWKVYNAAVYVLVRAGCTVAAEKTNV